MELVSTIMTGSGDATIQHYSQLAAELEKQEIEAGGKPLDELLYSQLLAIYCLQDDLPNAKFLWKRIPASIKQSSQELTHIWEVCKNLWNKDHTAIYLSLKTDWSDSIKPIMIAIEEATRKRAVNLISKAYSHIHIENFAIYVGLPLDAARELVSSLDLAIDPNTSMIIIPSKQADEDTTSFTSDEHLETLTAFVSFMEN